MLDRSDRYLDRGNQVLNLARPVAAVVVGWRCKMVTLFHYRYQRVRHGSTLIWENGFVDKSMHCILDIYYYTPSKVSSSASVR